MSYTLTHPSAGPGGVPLALTLPPDLLWINEFAWRPVEQAAAYTTTGALVLDQWTRQAGRSIELRGDDRAGWIGRATLRTLHAWAAQTPLQLTLQIGATTYTVAFDHTAGPIEATPVIPFSDPIDGDYYIPVLRFLTI